MSHPGVSPEREKATPSGRDRGTLGGAAGFTALKVCLRAQAATLPNMRVQRTRSSASPLRSPLTRYLLGRQSR
jgi:hypothetical protein